MYIKIKTMRLCVSAIVLAVITSIFLSYSSTESTGGNERTDVIQQKEELQTPEKLDAGSLNAPKKSPEKPVDVDFDVEVGNDKDEAKIKKPEEKPPDAKNDSDKHDNDKPPVLPTSKPASNQIVEKDDNDREKSKKSEPETAVVRPREASNNAKPEADSAKKVVDYRTTTKSTKSQPVEKPAADQKSENEAKKTSDLDVKPVETSLQRAAADISVGDLKAQIDALQKQVDFLLTSTPKPDTKRFPPVKFLNYKHRKRILITGGAGFVGSHLVDHLMQQGHEVVALDNHFTGRKRNVEHWIGHPNFELVHHDIVNPFFIEVDQIYHLASPASPPHYMFNPVKTIKTNVLGSINMLGLSRRTKSTILLASTSEVYGDPEVHPQPETYWGRVNAVGPRSCYDEGKRVSESLFVAYEKQEQVPIRIARIFNTFGPRMHMNDGRVVSNFILQALQAHNITVYGSGKQTRSFQYVTDLVEGLVALMNSNVSTPVNLGNPEEHSMDEFAHIIKDLVGSNSSIVHEESPVDDPQQRRPDITKAAKLLGWKPRVSMVDGLRKTITYFADELKHNEEYELANGKLEPQHTPLEHFEADTLLKGVQ